METYENPKPEVGVNRSVEIHLLGPPAQITVEFRPAGISVEQEELKEAAKQVRAETETVETFVTEFYTLLVEELYPGYSSYDDPWEKADMVVEYRTNSNGTRDTTTLGHYG